MLSKFNHSLESCIQLIDDFSHSMCKCVTLLFNLLCSDCSKILHICLYLSTLHILEFKGERYDSLKRLNNTVITLLYSCSDLWNSLQTHCSSQCNVSVYVTFARYSIMNRDIDDLPHFSLKISLMDRLHFRSRWILTFQFWINSLQLRKCWPMLIKWLNPYSKTIRAVK